MSPTRCQKVANSKEVLTHTFRLEVGHLNGGNVCAYCCVCGDREDSGFELCAYLAEALCELVNNTY